MKLRLIRTNGNLIEIMQIRDRNKVGLDVWW